MTCDGNPSPRDAWDMLSIYIISLGSCLRPMRRLLSKFCLISLRNRSKRPGIRLVPPMSKTFLKMTGRSSSESDSTLSATNSARPFCFIPILIMQHSRSKESFRNCETFVAQSNMILLWPRRPCEYLSLRADFVVR